MSDEEIDKSVNRVIATMKISGIELTQYQIKRLYKIARGEIDGGKCIEKYIRRVIRLTKEDNNE